MTATAAVHGRRVFRLRRGAFAELSALASVYGALIGLMGLLVFGFYPDNMDSVQQLGLGLFWSFAVAAALFWRARTPLRRTALFQHLIAAAWLWSSWVSCTRHDRRCFALANGPASWRQPS